ncbi:hypothetical protein ACIBK1_02465 [Microbispora rosea]|nr:hypothetical protein [Microbispora rosea]
MARRIPSLAMSAGENVRVPASFTRNPVRNIHAMVAVADALIRLRPRAA